MQGKFFKFSVDGGFCPMNGEIGIRLFINEFE